MKCLITGANGVVGKNLFEILGKNPSFEVWGTGRSKLNLRNYFSIDLMDKSSVIDFFLEQRFDCIIHCAATVSNDQPIEVLSNNYNSTLNVIEASLMTSVKKIFHTSGITVIGEILEIPITETHTVKPLTTYTYSKFQSEKIIERFCENKIDFVNMRIPSPAGKYMPLRSVLPIFLNRIQKGLDIKLYGEIKRKMNFIDLRDLANFINKASRINGVSGVFNVGAIKSYSDLELAETIISITGSRSKIIDNMTNEGGGIQDWNMSCLKAKNVFNYEPEFSLRQTIEWILAKEK